MLVDNLNNIRLAHVRWVQRFDLTYPLVIDLVCVAPQYFLDGTVQNERLDYDLVLLQPSLLGALDCRSFGIVAGDGAIRSWCRR